MRLIRCKVQNFGKLHEFEYEFVEGLNTINELNGWGKTTFVVFIKSMFYGLEASKKQNLDENERKKYQPWQGGNYGGYLVFEIRGNVYRIERFFGATAKKDEFKLYNERTGLLSYDYSETIGSDLFHIDKQAFERSIYIPQDSLIVTSNDSIVAKLTDLVEDSNDILNYESAKSALMKKQKEYQTVGEKGKIPDLSRAIAKLKQELEACEEAKRTLEHLEGQKKELEVCVLEERKRLERIREAMHHANEYTGKAAKKTHYEAICSNLMKSKRELEEKKYFFHGQVPTNEEIEQYEQLNERIKDEKRVIAQCNMGALEQTEFKKLHEFFNKKDPNREELKRCEEWLYAYDKKQEQLKYQDINEHDKEQFLKLKQFFIDGVPSEERVNELLHDVEELNDLKVNISVQKERMRILQTDQDYKTSHKKLFIIGAIVALFVGIIGFITIPFIGVVGIIGAIILFSLFLKDIINKNHSEDNRNIQDKRKMSQDNVDYQHNEAARNSLTQMQQKEVQMKNKIQSFLDTYQISEQSAYSVKTIMEIKSKRDAYVNLRSRMQDCTQEVEGLKRDCISLSRRIETVLGVYVQPLSMTDYKNVLEEVLRRSQRYSALRMRMNTYLISMEKLREIEPSIKEFLGRYFTEVQEPYTRLLTLVKTNLTELHSLVKNYRNCLEQQEQFERTLTEQELKNLCKIEEHGNVPVQDASTFVEEEAKSIEKLDALNQELMGSNGIRYNIQKQQECLENQTELESEVERLSEELKVALHREFMLGKTLEFLKKAKEECATGYLQEMNQGFLKYVKMIDENVIENANLDEGLQVMIEDQGKKRQVDFFSRGYKDLIGLCTRLALIEGLFKEEKPFIILDDPFVNLDEGKMTRAMKLLENLSEHYQVIYLVCHTSRVV